MLVETTGIVCNAMEAGKTLEQIQAEGLPEQWKPLESGPIDAKSWIAAIYASFQAGKKNPAGSTHH